jgi:glycolate oxidase FAD binding subunit
MQPNRRIDDLELLAIAEPQSVAEVGDSIRHAIAQRLSVYPLGGRTLLHLGLPPTKPGSGIDLRRLDKVIDYPARDMTVTVQAGVTIAKLQELLKTERQQLPVDIPFADQATLGGALATNCSGPRRLGHGTLRDYVIGISAVNDEGQEIKAGGRVVKNVAGYDLCKLFVGSLGTLGIITQVTLKLRPLPEVQRMLLLPCPPDRLTDLVERLHGSRTTPISLDLLNRGAVAAVSRQPELGAEIGVTMPPKWHLLAVGFEGNTKPVEWQLAQLKQELPAEMAPLACELSGAEPAALYTQMTDFLDGAESRFTFKANVLPSRAVAFSELALSLSNQLLLEVQLGNGIVVGHIDGEFSLEQAQSFVKQLQEAAVEAQGNVVVRRCPIDWKRSLPIWGNPRDDVWLMRTIKSKLDPTGLFNPGRFVDGI